ncbi:MAG: TonB-dependent receptor [Gemmatimonadetes bacterium]|nr:TonB-dependent receptor [Gemmatimonadota bacterium]
MTKTTSARARRAMHGAWFAGAVALAVTLSIGRVSPLYSQQLRELNGQVLATSDSSPVAGALVEALGSAARSLSDRTGRFSIPRPDPESLRITIRALGFRTDTLAVPQGRDSLTVFLVRAAVQLAPVEVEAGPNVARTRFEELAQLSTVTLSAPELRRVPTILEPDVLRAIQLLPGTVARNDFSTGYNVRGGESDQNLVQLDGITVFNPSHLGGLFSTFDPDAVGKADFVTGGFPARYSGRLSSVLDIVIRSGDSTRVRGAGQLSLLSSKLLLEGPLPGSGTFLVSARRTYLDAVVSAFTKEVLPYYFTDLLAKVAVPTGRLGSVALTGYWGRDALNLNLVDSTELTERVDLKWNWGNHLLGAAWTLPLGAGELLTRAAASGFSTTLGLFPGLARYDNTALLFNAGSSLSLSPGNGHALQVGVAGERYRMHEQIATAAFDQVLLDNRYRTTVWSAFLDEQWSVSRRFLLRPGMRLEHVPQARFVGFSPRVAAKLFLSRDAAVTASAGRYYQPVHSVWDPELPITVYEFWISSDRDVPVARSDHLVLGLESWIRRDVQVTVEGYRKTFDRLVTPNRAQDLSRQGDEFILANGNAWGFDVLLRRHAGTVRGWVAYSFTRTRRTSEGISYPAAHDRRHTVNVVVQAPGPFRSSLAVRWGYGSPLPYTGFIGQWDHRRYNATDHVFDDSSEEPVAGPRNGARYPYYSRLDAGLRWSVQKRRVTWEPYFQVVNAYNRRNVFLYFFDYGNSPPTRTGVSQLPLLPTFGLDLRF